MNTIDRLFELRTTPPFDQLRQSELVLIAAAAWTREYRSGETIGHAGRPLRHLYILAEGSAEWNGEPVPHVFGTESLLQGTPLDQPIRAGGIGATCILIRRGHFHTILSECPALVVGLLRRPAAEEIAAR